MSGDTRSVVLEGLVKRFGNFTAVDHISLETSKGEIFGFLGPNGAGKSTTIRMLCGLLRPTSGHAVVAGFDVAREPDRAPHFGDQLRRVAGLSAKQSSTATRPSVQVRGQAMQDSPFW